MNVRLLNVSTKISLIDPREDCFRIPFCPGRSVRHARYRYGGTYRERERLDNIPRLMREVKFICPGIKRSNKARIGLKGLQ